MAAADAPASVRLALHSEHGDTHRTVECDDLDRLESFAVEDRGPEKPIRARSVDRPVLGAHHLHEIVDRLENPPYAGEAKENATSPSSRRKASTCFAITNWIARQSPALSLGDLAEATQGEESVANTATIANRRKKTSAR